MSTVLVQSSLPAPSRPLRAMLLAAVAMGGVLLFAGPARAGDYRVYFCKTPTGQPLNLNWPGASPVWRASYGSNAAAVEECAKGGRMGLFLGGGGSTSVEAGTTAGWTYYGPSYAAVTINRSVITRPGADSPSTTAQYFAGWASGQFGLELCAAVYGCQRDMGPFDAGGGSALSLQAQCGGPKGGYCEVGPTPRVDAEIDSIEMRLTDSSLPTAFSIGGTAIGAGTHTGVESVNFEVSDYGNSGLADAVATVDGVEVGRVSLGECTPFDRNGGIPSFTRLYECKNAASAVVPIDTTRVPDGRHALRVTVADQSGNTTTVVNSTRLDIENVPAPANAALPSISGPGLATGLRPGDQVTAVNGTWRAEPGVKFTYKWQRSGDGGFVDIAKATGASYTVSPDDIGHALRVAVTATDAQGTTTAVSEPTSPVKSGATIQTQSVDTGAAGSGGDPSTAQLVVDREQRTVDVKHGSKIVITGRLVDADGQPIAGAQVDVFEQLVVTAAPWNKVGSVTTDSQGGYAYRPKTTGSRRLRFAYADQRNAADYRATREVLVSVTAGMTIGTKHHVLSRKGTIRLKGRVQVDGLPTAGVWVEVQVLDAGVWRTVATRRTSRTGLWKFQHRLRGSAGITFKFRSRLRPAGDVASAEAKSAPVRVRVR